jgi:hypothetical protein
MAGHLMARHLLPGHLLSRHLLSRHLRRACLLLAGRRPVRGAHAGGEAGHGGHLGPARGGGRQDRQRVQQGQGGQQQAGR